jgi:hypothetical protein
MLRLLCKAAGSGYPADYLLARLNGRRTHHVPTSAAKPEERDDRRYWEAAAAERTWLFHQLDLELRAELASLFVFFELGAMARSLRYLAGGKPDEADRVLESSMLSPKLGTILRGRDGVREALMQLDRFFAGTPLHGAGLGAAYDLGGLLACEEQLRRRFLLRVLEERLPSDLAMFFRAVADIRNILATAKWLRWRPDMQPALISGGRTGLSGKDREMTGGELARMVRSFTRGLDITGEELRPERLEPALQSYLQLDIHRRRRQGGVVAACIDYVFGGFSNARRHSIHLHTGGEA